MTGGKCQPNFEKGKGIGWTSDKWLRFQHYPISQRLGGGMSTRSQFKLQDPGELQDRGTRQTWSEIRKTLRHSSPTTFLLQKGKITGTSLKALDWTKPGTKESESEVPLWYKQTHWQVLSLLSSQSGLLVNTHLPPKWAIHCFHFGGKKKKKNWSVQEEKKTTDTDILGSFSDRGKSLPIVLTQSLTSQHDQSQI